MGYRDVLYKGRLKFQFQGATFLGAKMPDELPDISNHSSFLADALRANPDVYKNLKDKKTKLGVTLGHCIKTGIDNPGKSVICNMTPYRSNFCY